MEFRVLFNEISKAKFLFIAPVIPYKAYKGCNYKALSTKLYCKTLGGPLCSVGNYHGAVLQSVEYPPSKGSGPVQVYWREFESRPQHKMVGRIHLWNMEIRFKLFVNSKQKTFLNRTSQQFSPPGSKQRKLELEVEPAWNRFAGCHRRRRRRHQFFFSSFQMTSFPTFGEKMKN